MRDDDDDRGGSVFRELKTLSFTTTLFFLSRHSFPIRPRVKTSVTNGLVVVCCCTASFYGLNFNRTAAMLLSNRTPRGVRTVIYFYFFWSFSV